MTDLGSGGEPPINPEAREPIRRSSSLGKEGEVSQPGRPATNEPTLGSSLVAEKMSRDHVVSDGGALTAQEGNEGFEVGLKGGVDPDKRHSFSLEELDQFAGFQPLVQREAGQQGAARGLPALAVFLDTWPPSWDLQASVP
jgi:hypothetical protein